MIKLNLNDISARDPKVKYAATKQAIKLSAKNPQTIYPDLEFFVKLLDSENNIFVWTAIKVIGNLSAVDTKNQIDKSIPKLFKLFHSERMITSANAIIVLMQIAQNKPKYKAKIIKELLKIEKNVYMNKGEISPECRNIAIGHFLNCIKLLTPKEIKKYKLIDFIKRQTSNTRPSVAKRASKLIEIISNTK